MISKLAGQSVLMPSASGESGKGAGIIMLDRKSNGLVVEVWSKLYGNVWETTVSLR